MQYNIEVNMLNFSFQEAQQVENVDAYIVIFSVTDRNSFSYAHACLQDLTRKGVPSRKKVIIVVANKQDSMRNRVISENGQCAKDSLINGVELIL
jgi:sRNA-binding regulator protein Hfq